MSHNHKDCGCGGKQSDESNKHQDPVCKMMVCGKTAKATYTYQGVKYYFCHVNCLAKFKGNEKRYLNAVN